MFPYAGAGTSVFKGWQETFSEDVDVFTVYLPGREGRFCEEPIGDLAVLVEQLSEAIASFIDIPYIFVGHSNGALIAFELARKIADADQNKPLHIVLSAKRSPDLPPEKPFIHNLPYDDLIEELRQLAAIPSEVLDDRDMMEMFLPMIRADFAIGADYDFSETPQLSCNASLFWGREDEEVPKQDVLEWKKFIAGNVLERDFAGGHLFIDSAETEFKREICTLLDHYASSVAQ